MAPVHQPRRGTQPLARAPTHYGGPPCPRSGRCPSSATRGSRPAQACRLARTSFLPTSSSPRDLNRVVKRSPRRAACNERSRCTSRSLVGSVGRMTFPPPGGAVLGAGQAHTIPRAAPAIFIVKNYRNWLEIQFDRTCAQRYCPPHECGRMRRQQTQAPRPVPGHPRGGKRLEPSLAKVVTPPGTSDSSSRSPAPPRVVRRIRAAAIRSRTWPQMRKT